MSEVVESMPSTGWKRKYPWELWFDGRVHMLERGKDFHTEPDNFRIQVHASAARRDLDVHTSVRGDKIYIQAVVTP